MTLNWKFVVVGLFVCTAGGWLIFKPDPSDFLESGGATAALVSESVDPESDRSLASQVESTESADADSVTAANPPTTQPLGAELSGLTPQTIPAPTVVESTNNCDSDYGGLGVEYRAWGDVLLPYTPGYPTSDPGEVWDCTANTVFGGAIAMVHAAYLEALRPDVIPAIAVDSPGRTARINTHTASNSNASLGFLCSPIGWNWDGEATWSLLHRCGEGEPRLSYFEMEYREDRWWLVYPRSGDIETIEPPAGYEYYAFIGGD